MKIPDHILAMCERMRTQDNHGTSNPAYCVQKMERVESVEGSVESEWRDDEWEVADDEKAEALDLAEAEGDDAATEGWTKVGFHSYWHTVRACLTEKGAADYIADNGHNLSEYAPPRIYVESLHRCQEMIRLREWLMTIAPPATAPAPGVQQ